MKMMKKIAMLMLSVCLVLPCFSMLTYAADGEIMFTDPSTTVGETLAVKGVVEAEAALEDMTVNMTYDTSMLKFKNGDNVTETVAGQLTYEVKGQVHGTRVEYMMYFDVLKEGTTRIEVSGHDVWLDSDEQVNCVQGSSTIQIAAGEAPGADTPDEPAAGVTTVNVNGVTYTFSSEFAATEIPEGFTETTIEYEGSQHKVVQDSVSGIMLGYLVDAQNNGKFFMYEQENATFSAFEQIVISETTTIALLSDTSEVSLPEQYKETTVTLNEQTFPAWQDEEDTQHCILYAVNNKGVASLYQLDIEEGTYQRFEAPEEVQMQEEPAPNDESMFGKLSDILKQHLDFVILGAGLGFIFLVIVILVLSVKLYNRNAELDELYDEYGIDVDEESEGESKEKTAVIEEITEEKEEAEELIEEDSREEESPIFEDLDDFFAGIDEEVTGEKEEIVESAEESEIEVEFFEEEPEIEVEIFEEETIVKKAEEFYDDEEEFYDDFDEDFDVDFIDLDD